MTAVTAGADLSLSMRAMLAVGYLWAESIPMRVGRLRMTPGVWDEVAGKLRHAPVSLERYEVTKQSPLAARQIDGDEAIDERDEDVILTDSFRRLRVAYGTPPKSVILVLAVGDEFIVLDAASDADVSTPGAGSADGSDAHYHHDQSMHGGAMST